VTGVQTCALPISYLFHKNIKKLDTIIVTHPDADHFNGLRFIIQHFSPNTLWVKDSSGHNEEYRQIIAFARSRHVEIIMPQSGDKIGSDLAFVQCLANFEDHAETPGQINNSLVLKVCDHDICALFPGDIEATAEGMLVDSGIDVQARILLAPHHGSATSSSEKFLEAVQPDIIFISAGKNDQRYFPNPNITSRYKQLQIAFFNTAETGSMETSLSAVQQEITAYRHIRANPLLPLEKFSLFQDIHHQMKQ
jgi:competence protein ComEC